MSKSESPSGIVFELAEEFLGRYRDGQRPALKEYIDRHPEFAEEIREVFPAMAMMENIAIADEPRDGDSKGKYERPPAAPLQQLGDYRIIREVGHGGMGVVYEAEQISLGRLVALKVLRNRMVRDSRHRRRFEREARSAAKLHHTNIVPVFGFGEDEGTAYYVMQFIHGLGLDAVIDEIIKARDARSPASNGSICRNNEVPHSDVSAAELARSLLTGRLGVEVDHSRLEELPTSPEATSATSPAGTRSFPPPDLELGRGADGEAKAGTRAGGVPIPSGCSSPSSSSVSILTQGSGGASGMTSKRLTYCQGVARIGVQVADALTYAHQQGILHRDIKPSNLLLDMQGTVWVADFGLAKADDQENLTQTGDILGTLRYMPPEALEGKSGVRSDVYSLGLTIYELLAHRPAFHERERGRLIQQVTSEEPPRLRKLNSEVPLDLETIVHKAIEKNPSRRYPTPGELGDDLRRFLESRPILARRVGPGERVQRWARRNPWVASLLAVVFLLLGTIATGTTIMAIRVQEKALEALGEARRATSTLALAEKANAELRVTRDQLRRTLYASQINLAQGAWDSGNVSRMLGLLEKQRPGPGEADLRGFEWNYLWKLCHGDLRTVHIPLVQKVGSATISPDGKLVAALSRKDERLRLNVWETASGGLKHSLDIAPTTKDGVVNATRPVFSRSGKRIAAGVTVNLEMIGKQIREIRVWEVESGREVRRVTDGLGYMVNGLALSPDGRFAAATTGSDPLGPLLMRSSLRVWDLGTGRTMIDKPGGWYGWVEFSPDGRQVAAAGRHDGEGQLAPSFRVQIWDATNGQEVRAITGVPGFPVGVAFSPDGGLLATSWFSDLTNGTLRLFETATSKERWKADGVAGLIEHLAFSPDGKRLGRGAGADTTVPVWDVETGRLELAMKGHDGVVDDVAFIGNDRVVSVATDQSIKHWKIEDQRPVSDRRPAITAYVHTDLNREGVLAASVSLERNRYDELHVLNAGGQPGVRIRRAGYHVGVVALSPDRAKLAAIEWNFNSEHQQYFISLFEVSGARELRSIPGPYIDVGLESLPSLEFSPQGDKLAVALAVFDREKRALGSELHVFRIEDGKELLRLREEPKALTCVTFSPDGRHLATGERRKSGMSRVRIREIASGRPQLELEGHETAVNWLAYSPDGHRLASCSGEEWQTGEIKIWDATTGRLLLRMAGHNFGVSCIAFSPDGRRLASTGWALALVGEVKLWDADSGLELMTLNVREGPVNRVTFSRDGTRLFAAGGASVHHPRGPVLTWDATPAGPPRVP